MNLPGFLLSFHLEHGVTRPARWIDLCFGRLYLLVRISMYNIIERNPVR